MIRFQNLTPHELTVAGRIIPAGDHPARVAVSCTEVRSYDGIPVVQTFGAVQGLPDPADGVIYIVAGMVRAALGNTRPDVVAPDTGPTAIRNDAGHLVGVTRLVGVRS